MDDTTVFLFIVKNYPSQYYCMKRKLCVCMKKKGERALRQPPPCLFSMQDFDRYLTHFMDSFKVEYPEIVMEYYMVGEKDVE